MLGHAGYLRVAIVLVTVFLPGCREELGPEQYATARVSGTITLGGRPIGKGWIEFIPTEGTVGKLRSAPIRSDGSFEADQVAVGWNQIGLVNAAIDRGLALEFHPLSSSIRRKIPPHRSVIAIDLLDEALKNQKAVMRQP